MGNYHTQSTRATTTNKVQGLTLDEIVDMRGT